jgi:hypothetical protein
MCIIKFQALVVCLNPPNGNSKANFKSNPINRS